MRTQRTSLIFSCHWLNFPSFHDDGEYETLREVLEDEETPFTEAVDRARQVYMSWKPYASQSAPGKPRNSLWSTGCVADHTPYKLLIDENDSDEWGAWNITDIRPSKGIFPHSKATIYNNCVAKDMEVLRGELLAVLRLMLGRLKKRTLVEHMTAPVLLVSFMGKHACAIESYYTGEHLVVRISRRYNFPHETVTAFKTLAEWYRSDPTGDTMS